MHAIRKATRADVDEIYQVRNAAIRHGCAGFYEQRIIDMWTAGDAPSEEFCSLAEKRSHVIDIDGNVAAWGAVIMDTGQIDAMFVNPAYMKMGLGRAIIAHLEAILISRGFAECNLKASLNAAGFYRSLGYVGNDIGEHQSPRGFTMPCVPMRKIIKRSPI